MYRRTMAAVTLLVVALGFAPAPVFRERPAPKELLKRMQGIWTINDSIKLNGHRTTLVRIKGNTWTYVFMIKGKAYAGTPTVIVMGADRDLVTLDLEVREPGGTRRLLCGIVKIEGAAMSVCWSPAAKAERPKLFAEAGPRAWDSADKDISPFTMILRKVE